MSDYFNQISERLVYRKVKKSDTPEWIPFFENNDRLHFLGIDTTKENHVNAKEWIGRQQARYKDDGTGLLALIRKTDGQFLGMCGILKRELDDEIHFEIGYSLLPKFWKNGYATEAAKQMRQFGHESGISNEFISIIHKDNRDSISVARRNEMLPFKKCLFMNMPVIVYKTK